MPSFKTSQCKIKSQAASQVMNLWVLTHRKAFNAGPLLHKQRYNFSCTTNGQQKQPLSVCRVVAVLVNLLLFLSGNLYSRHIQIDGEMLAIQVQDTPGVQVSYMQPCSSPKQLQTWVCVSLCAASCYGSLQSLLFCVGDVVTCLITSEARCVACL